SKKEGTPKLSKGEKHSYRMTAVLPKRRDGAKLSILFVTKGQSGGRIDTHEIMAPFKRHMRDLCITEGMVSHGDDDNDDENWMSPAAHVKLTTMIKRAIDAWEKITPEQIRGSFLKAILNHQ
ncbi:hypothetical protein DYB36_013010, partial [Aphanomyces astaci]